ncbi:uncharacterized protein [Haliotis cracherodii]|uniref:uncharacterized protein n=1 Tax=Haliotis cracherodii TaxID=6455 RepID=UPI0039EA30E2
MKNNATAGEAQHSVTMSNGRDDTHNGYLNEDYNHNVTTPVQVRPRHLENGRKRKLVLHFDVRNTVLVADSVTNVHMEQALNSFLSGVVWGNEQEDGSWRWQCDEPSLVPPQDGVITYYRHLEKLTVKCPSDRERLRFQTGDFTDTDIGYKFLPHFQKHLELLKWNYSKDETCDRRLTMKGVDGKPYHYILPSVYKLIHQLKEDRRDFAIVIRTYGLDCKNVLSSLSFGLKGNHPGFPQDAHLPVSTFPGCIRRTESGEITLETWQTGVGDVVEKLQHERDIYRHLSNSSGITGYKDDFQIWQNNNYHHSVAKPLWIDPSDTHVHHIIFDDNFRAYEEDSIVDARMFDTDDKTKARSLTRKELERFEDVCLVQANLLESIENENYFIEKVNKCESGYSKFLKLGAL